MMYDYIDLLFRLFIWDDSRAEECDDMQFKPTSSVHLAKANLGILVMELCCGVLGNLPECK